MAFTRRSSRKVSVDSPSAGPNTAKTVAGLSAPPRFGPLLASIRTALRTDRLAFARAAGLSVRSLQRWERDDVLPRARERELLLTMVARRDPAGAVNLAAALGVPPPPGAVAVAPAIPEDLVVRPVEVAVFRAAESLGLSPAVLRPALVRFLGHLDALGIAPGKAKQELG